MALFWDAAKWQPSCDWHHSMVKQKLELMYEQGKASADDLWLNSVKAVSLTRELAPPGGV